MDTDRIAGSAKSALGKAEKVVGDAAREAVDTTVNAAGSAYGAGAEIVAERPGSALLFAGLVGFMLGVILTKGSQPPRRSRWQRIYDSE